MYTFTAHVHHPGAKHNKHDKRNRVQKALYIQHAVCTSWRVEHPKQDFSIYTASEFNIINLHKTS